MPSAAAARHRTRYRWVVTSQPSSTQAQDVSPQSSSSVPIHRTEPVSFVRRSARMTDLQQQAWDDNVETMLIDVPRAFAQTSVHPDFALDITGAFGREAPLVVEVGSGLGEAIVNAAANDPGRNYLALEVYKPGLALTMMKAAKAGVTNVRLIQANAPEVLKTALPEASVSELWSFFADPWHKKRHYKRRLFRPSFVPLLERVLSDGGLLRIATDWENYAEHIREVLARAQGLTNLDAAGEWSPRFEGRCLTSFERKALDAGREIRDLTYRRRFRS